MLAGAGRQAGSPSNETGDVWEDIKDSCRSIKFCLENLMKCYYDFITPFVFIFFFSVKMIPCSMPYNHNKPFDDCSLMAVRQQIVLGLGFGK